MSGITRSIACGLILISNAIICGCSAFEKIGEWSVNCCCAFPYFGWRGEEKTVYRDSEEGNAYNRFYQDFRKSRINREKELPENWHRCVITEFHRSLFFSGWEYVFYDESDEILLIIPESKPPDAIIDWHKALNPGNVASYIEELEQTKNWDSPRIHRIIFYLGEIGDRKAVEPLINVLEKAPVQSARKIAANSLGEIGDARAIEPLINALINDYDIRLDAAVSLGKIGTEQAVEALLAEWKKSDGSYLSLSPIVFGFRYCNDIRAVKALISFLEVNSKYDNTRWSAICALREIMPIEFPKIERSESEKQARMLHNWFDTHKHRLAWDVEKHRWYLKDDSGKKN
ncbi:MAG: HEAT repeat domain-containing protein [Planctomycetota bacterium]|jgi:hypothetical protein